VDVLSVGRVSVDLYAKEANAGFDSAQSFTKSVGGSPTNVAVACARLGLATALATKVGDDEFGKYVINRLTEFGVDTGFIGIQPDAQTPLAFAALTPPETPTIVFYRGEAAPDTSLTTASVSEQEIKRVKILWISQTSLSQGTTSQTCLEWMAMREKGSHTILDLDYRPKLWASKEEARDMATKAIALASIVVGNLEECEVALGTKDPNEAADMLLAQGVALAIIKLGPEGVLMKSASQKVIIPSHPIEVVCGLGAGDAFGGALCYGLLAGWDLEKIGTFANVAGALVATRLTCADAMPTVSEIESMLQGAA
jgi:5-dehydro-2-deoxygluconokinase